MREVDAVPGADLDHLAGQANQQLATAFGHAAPVHAGGHLRIHPAEQRPPPAHLPARPGRAHAGHQVTGSAVSPPVSVRLSKTSSSTAQPSSRTVKRAASWEKTTCSSMRASGAPTQ